MKMTDPKTDKHSALEMAALDALLADLAALPVEPAEPDLIGRILADAEVAQAAHAHRGPAVSSASNVEPSGWRGWLDALGGWPALGGLTAAAVTGLWIGVAPPAAVDDLMAGVLGETVSLDLSGLGETFELEG